MQKAECNAETQDDMKGLLQIFRALGLQEPWDENGKHEKSYPLHVNTPCRACGVPWFSEWTPVDGNPPCILMEKDTCTRCNHKQTAEELAFDRWKYGVPEYGLACFFRCSQCNACGVCGQRSGTTQTKSDKSHGQGAAS